MPEKTHGISSPTPQDLQQIYSRRFEGSLTYRNSVWRVLTSGFFVKWIRPQHSVLDLGCGYCQFINNIECAAKYGMDLNPSAKGYASKDVTLFEQDCSARWPLAENSLDAVFTSNFFEHLPTKTALEATLQEALRCLKPGGRLIAMGPNIAAVGGHYWDFFDHHVALTDQSLVEVLEKTGYKIERSVARFLPYTMVNAPEYPLAFLRLYLSLPFAWRFMGGQFLVVATKPQ